MILVVIIAQLMMSGCLALELETGWLSTITNRLPSWNNSDTVGNVTNVASHSKDDELEVENSIKLEELFPQLKIQLESSNEEERIQARQFVEKMKKELEENKRYTTMLWKGVKRIIDMGKLGSERRRFLVGHLVPTILVFMYLEMVHKISCWFFVDCTKKKSKSEYKYELVELNENNKGVSGGTKEQSVDKEKKNNTLFP